MFCPNCGKELNLTGRFCEHCGYDMSKDLEEAAANKSAATESDANGSAPQANPDFVGNAPVNGSMPTEPVPKKQRNNKVLIPIIAAVAVIAIIAVSIIAYVFFVPKKVNLTDYVDKVTFEGFDTRGTADIKVNEKQLKKDLAKKLKKPKASDFTKGKKDYDDILDGLQGIFDSVTDESSYAEILMDSVSFSIDPSSDLSNGDTVKLVIKYDNEVAKKFGIKFTKDEKSYKVKGLKDLQEVDPFDGVSLSVEGVSPYLSVKIVSNNSTFSEYDYAIEDEVIYEEYKESIPGFSEVGDYYISGYTKIKKMYNELIGSNKAGFTIDATDGLK